MKAQFITVFSLLAAACQAPAQDFTFSQPVPVLEGYFTSQLSPSERLRQQASMCRRQAAGKRQVAAQADGIAKQQEENAKRAGDLKLWGSMSIASNGAMQMQAKADALRREAEELESKAIELEAQAAAAATTPKR